MVDYFVYAKDFSKSTYRVKHYHTNGLKTLDQFKRDVEKIKEGQLVAGEPPTESKIVYLHWNENCYEVDEDEIRRTYLELESEWVNREPQSIIRFLKEKYVRDANDKIKLLYLITDGAISNENAEECFELNRDMDYDLVVFHAINEDTEKIDLSVAASFFKSRCIVHCNNELCDTADISKEFDYDKINGDNFSVEKDRLKSYIKLKMITKLRRDVGDWQEIDNLRKLRDRLHEELSLKTPKCPFFDSYLQPKRRKLAMLTFNSNQYEKLFIAVYEMKQDAEKSVATLIRYIMNNGKSYALNALKFDTKVDQSVEEKQNDDDDFTDDLVEIEPSNFVLEHGEQIPNLSEYICNVCYRNLSTGTCEKVMTI